MAAIDMVAYDVHNATGAPIGLTAATVTPGDSSIVRNFPAVNPAYMEAIAVQSSGVRAARVTSPLLHDNVTGMTFQFAEQPSSFLLPQEVGQPIQPGDTLTVALDAAATSDSVAALIHYYTNLPGTAARLAMWGDISGNVKSIKPVEIDCVSSATIAAWSDTLITNTENQYHAKTDYAVLGYQSSVAVAAVAVKGQETANLRVGGPGVITSFDTSDYFITMSALHGRPHIPVISADNRFSVYVSVLANTASVATKITLILAELSQPFGS